MKILRKLFLVSVAVFLIWGGIFANNRLTDGFSMRQITSSLPPYPEYEVSLSENQFNHLQTLLNQPFHYIGKGCQFYAFESKDGNLVLKFLKHKHLRPLTWLNRIPMPQKCHEWRHTKIKQRQERVENLFSSCKLAYEELQNETGLFYIHLNRVPALRSKIVIIDKLGLKHRIELDKYEFVIQEKAVQVKDAFADAQSEEELKERIGQLVELVKSRCHKGIADRDRSFVQNVAFSSKAPHALFIDTGQFYKDPQIVQKEAIDKDVEKRLTNLRYWTQRHFPEYVSVVDEFLEKSS